MKAILPLLLAALASGCVLVAVPGAGAKAGGTVLLCHKGKKTMELPQEAARAHLDHGDRYGAC
ncbi:hypothetical protein AAG565_14850 [Fontimonas sp. SYSU GA230001]|uniref:hypothetical protein n=1 Tax=Fontimonas sp. SYSU GA230001 TaxID=3142450 RepID=UPI0032B3BD00